MELFDGSFIFWWERGLCDCFCWGGRACLFVGEVDFDECDWEGAERVAGEVGEGGVFEKEGEVNL